MKSKEIRDSFLKFFEDRGHKIVPSSSVVPYDDPTLLFTNAGMNQFKDVFLGVGTRDYKRAADTQKCIRAGGKHNDLEEVGFDGYHHTFFEMLGNWSFGDYYKKEALTWSWELLTKTWGIPKDRLWATVYRDDDESYEIWKNETDIDPSHILRFDEKDNFWEMGDTGPCGPCSEIHIDLTEDGCTANDVNSDNENVIEIWNNVFIQYNRDENGVLTPLPNKHVDTGMGFERVCRALQKKKSNYETDVFTPILNKISELTGKKYEGDNISPMNILADHIRTLVFAISDGAIPSNEGRGYVLRRILRRASRFARKLDFHRPILWQLVDTVAENFGYIFPEVAQKKEDSKKIIKAEEDSFNITLDRGIELFNNILRGNIHKQVEDVVNRELGGYKIFSGEDAFKLYDTYGFPVDLTQVMAKENGYEVDMDAFNLAMKRQKDMSRKAQKDLTMQFQFSDGDEHKINIDYKYVPWEYDGSEVATNVLGTVLVEEAQKMRIYLWKNPFFAESGGQISDTGKLITEDKDTLNVIQSLQNSVIIDRPYEFKKGFDVKVKVDYDRRQSIERNHSATHLMHEALKRTLGDTVKQMGSLVSDEYLRFDFPHFKKVEAEEIKKIEDMVNEKIAQNIIVKTEIKTIEEANKIPNVKKLFTEKYGDEVRVVTIDPDFSVEFCGGTHVKSTGEIGLFKIIKEESISSGVRRIFAITGKSIIDYLNEKNKELYSILDFLPENYSQIYYAIVGNLQIQIIDSDFKDINLMKKLVEEHSSILLKLNELKEKYLEEKKELDKQMLKQNLEKAFVLLDELINKAPELNGSKVLVSKIIVHSSEEFKLIGEEVRKKLRNGIALLASILDDKINLVCTVSDNLISDKKLSAGNIIRDAAKQLGGGGGGRPQLATAGGKDIKRLDEVLSSTSEEIKKLLS
ncbi:MAG: alanine--tRNA ligase [Bacteroidetes bacterium]|nr:alanine--tRNA ligase [Bacteroidota bacterium]